MFLNIIFFVANLSFFAFLNKKWIISLIENTSAAVYIAGWKYTTLVIAFLIKLKLQQWWGKNIEKTADGKYIMSHVINNQEVKVIVTTVSKEKQPSKILTENRDDITEYAAPFFRIKPEQVSSDFFFENFLIHVDDNGKESIF